jgi:hypothetical protein
MPEAQFKVGQPVCLQASWVQAAPAGQFIVLQVLSSRGSDTAYRVCGSSDGLERLMKECDLKPQQ